jgi:signal transduction histidine kinase
MGAWRDHDAERRGMHDHDHLRDASGAWHPPDGSWFDDSRARSLRLWLPVVLCFVAQVPATVVRLRLDTAVSTAELAFGVVIALIGPLALLGARRFPGPVVAVVVAAASADLLVTSTDAGPPYLALAFAVVLAIVRGARVWAWVSVATGWVVTLAIAVGVGISWHPVRITAITLGILLLFGIGESIRTRRERFDEMRRRSTERRLTEAQAERVRIARELHDVLAHSLSQINVQAGVGLHLMDRQPQKAAEALASIKETSRSALDEVRSVLGVLRAEGADPDAPLVPEPDLSRLAGLAASVTAQGIAVTVIDRLGSTPGAALQLAMYRIVQESLTNALRHSGATSATVTLDEHGGAYRVVVADDGAGAAGDASTEGRGLLGMRERAELLGGTLAIGGARGFTVTAELPSGVVDDS